MNLFRKIFLPIVVLAFLFTGCQNEKGAETKKRTEVSTLSVEEVVKAYFAEMPSHKRLIAQVDFVEKVIAGADMTILDLRKAEDYNKGHIKGAVNVPWGPALYQQLAHIPQEGEVYIYCLSGQTAGQAVVLLNIAGVPAISVKYGWKFGLSKVENIGDVIVTEATTLDASVNNKIDPAIDAAYKAYYDNLAAIEGTVFKNNIVSEENAKAIIDADEGDAVVVSIRKPEDYAAGHIKTASNIPWGKGIQEMFESLPADKKILVYCYSGQFAGQTVAGLKLIGYDAVSIKGGFGTPVNTPSGWNNKKFPVVK